jgi:hypothetical protein
MNEEPFDVVFDPPLHDSTSERIPEDIDPRSIQIG